MRRSPPIKSKLSISLPLDLHVLSLSLAFILSQDQTLRCYLFLFFFFSVLSVNQNKYQLQDPGRWLLLTEGSRPLPSSCILSHNFNVLCSPLKGKAVTKVQPFYLTTKFFAEKIFKPPQQPSEPQPLPLLRVQR